MGIARKRISGGNKKVNVDSTVLTVSLIITLLSVYFCSEFLGAPKFLLLALPAVGLLFLRAESKAILIVLAILWLLLLPGARRVTAHEQRGHIVLGDRTPLWLTIILWILSAVSSAVIIWLMTLSDPEMVAGFWPMKELKDVLLVVLGAAILLVGLFAFIKSALYYIIAPIFPLKRETWCGVLTEAYYYNTRAGKRSGIKNYCIKFEGDSKTWRIGWILFARMKDQKGLMFSYTVLTGPGNHHFLRSAPKLVRAGTEASSMEPMLELEAAKDAGADV